MPTAARTATTSASHSAHAITRPGPAPLALAGARGPLLTLAFLACLAGLAGPVWAQSEEEQARARLQRLAKDIERVTWEIEQSSKRRSRLQEQLKSAEVERGRLQREIADTRREIEAGRAELPDLEARRESLREDRDAQRERVALEMKTAWKMGNQGQLRVLLNLDNPQTVARAMAYYRYLFAARSDLLEGYRETLVELEAVRGRIDATLADLSARRASLQAQQEELAAAQRERSVALAELDEKIDSDAARLEELEDNRRELERLLQAIEEAVVDLAVPGDYQAFTRARGSMPWPVAGEPSNRFGRPRNEGKMRWQGVTIPAEAGATVSAIHHGRVVYADWLRGSGLLLIVDHGEGYMSLYAHNQSLLRDVGEWVSAGAPVSTVGDSGGLDRPALYFEIRHQGVPVDPAQWCRG